MKPLPFATLALMLGTLAACNPPAGDSGNADDFAARINRAGGNAAASPAAAPVPAEAAQPAQAPAPQPTPARIYKPLPGAAPGAYVAGTATDPKAQGCGAPQVARFFGKALDLDTRAQITQAVAPGTAIRFVQPGTTVPPDPRSQRLNVMIDQAGVIRDARCG